jgi:hypothetical protein
LLKSLEVEGEKWGKHPIVSAKPADHCFEPLPCPRPWRENANPRVLSEKWDMARGGSIELCRCVDKRSSLVGTTYVIIAEPATSRFAFF